MFLTFCVIIIGCSTNSLYFGHSMSKNLEYSSDSGQEKISPNNSTWNIHLKQDIVYSYVMLDSLKSGYLFISNEKKVTKVLIHEIYKIESTKESKSEGKEILGVLGGALVGGAIGFLVAPKGTLFGKTFIPDAEYYIAAGVVIGGTIGYFAFKSGQEEVYRFYYLTHPEKVSILNSLIK